MWVNLGLTGSGTEARIPRCYGSRSQIRYALSLVGPTAAVVTGDRSGNFLWEGVFVQSTDLSGEFRVAVAIILCGSDLESDFRVLTSFLISFAFDVNFFLCIKMDPITRAPTLIADEKGYEDLKRKRFSVINFA